MDVNPKNQSYVILTNFGDDSIALTQWAHVNISKINLKSIKVVYIDTGFAAQTWQTRILSGVKHAESLGFEVVCLTSKITFNDAVLGRGAFPDYKFQWCATLLKGLPLLDWLDQVDPKCESVILLGKRRETLPLVQHTLLEFSPRSEHYQDRAVWHPLLNTTQHERNQLLKEAGFEPLYHRSLECDPCVNSSVAMLAKLSEKDIEKVFALEDTLKIYMFQNTTLFSEKNIFEVVALAKNRMKKNKKNQDLELSLFYRGCGNPFGCGI